MLRALKEQLPAISEDNTKMPKTKDTVRGNDSSETEKEAPKPKTPAQSQENSSFCLEDHSPGSQPEVLSNMDMIDTFNKASNLSIAHEIMVNQDFCVEESVLPPHSLEGKFSEAMYNAFWDQLKEQLSSSPPNFNRVLELLREIKEMLMSLLLPHQNRLRNEIEEALDMVLLKQEAEHGALDIYSLSSYILSLITLLCAPSRDEAVQKLESITDPVDLLRGIFHVLGLMKMDMVNYTIQSLRSYLQEHSIQYERAKFQELLDNQPSLLDYTTKWLTKAAADLSMPSMSVSDSPSTSCSPPICLTNNSEHLSSTMVLYQGYLNLLLWDPANNEFPETLLMDRTRLQEMEFQLIQLTVLASVLLVARSFSGNILINSPDFVAKLKCITTTLMDEFNAKPEETMLSVSEQVSQEIHKGLHDIGHTSLSMENTSSLIGQIQNIAMKENCVRSVIDQRIRLFLKCCLARGLKESMLDFPGGLILIKEELVELGWKFVNLMRHNQQVFGPYYTEILKNIIPSDQP
ncbi:T-complex protein 11 X-linked protein 2-like [Erinaceus europaeus]|uniref:T-complex protein 11 X-linked protein 2-like n=1 Tax=Erinaceus europaeus TaxID=9365 RepID=A0A1S3WVI3_ERIEU|nr:T-complex protein 11 X-linked protein 2-like [Erinaceus europaeus]